ncbi:hypothetical protein L7F22_046484 [Adiantum nelumboides]|nr:hypothetical protein [Adiantum nelumboides]
MVRPPKEDSLQKKEWRTPIKSSNNSLKASHHPRRKAMLHMKGHLEGSESQDESMEDVARRRRAQRSPTPPKRKRSPHHPHCHESKREEKSLKKKKGRKRSPFSCSSSPSSSSDESSGYLLKKSKGEDTTDHMLLGRVEFFEIASVEFSRGTGIQSLNNGMAIGNHTVESEFPTEECWRNGIGEKGQAGTLFQAIIAPSANVTNERTNIAWRAQLEEQTVEVESDDSDSKSYQGSGDTSVAAFDPNEEETQVWLKCIGPYEFACLPWHAWVENEFEEQQWNMIKEDKGLIAGDVRLTPKLVSKVLKIPYLSMPAKGRKVTDSQMKGEFGNLIGAKSYYMVRNAGGIQATILFWYLEKVCILLKTYMSKEAFAPLCQAEQGVKRISLQLLQENSDKEKLQEEVAKLQVEGKAMTSKILSVAEDFQQWVDGLKTIVDEQFKELDKNVAVMTTENVLLINRLSPLAEMEKAVLQGQGMTRVLESVKRENEALKIENERLVAEMEEMRNNRKEIEDMLSKLKAKLRSGYLEPDRSLAMEAEMDVEKQADPDFVVEKAMEPEVEGDIGEQPT